MEKVTIKKIQDNNIAEVSAQCCCQIVGRPAVYQQNSCCKADCRHWFRGNDAVNTIYH